MTYFEIYLLTRLDSLQSLFLAIAIVAGLFTLVKAIIYGVEGEWDDRITPPKYKVMIPIILFSALSCALIPSKNEMLLILAGGKAFEYISNDKNIQKIPHQATEIFSKYLDKKLVELDSVTKK